jgi:long-subunit acyl-CoA synthetase (AMP-forming)
MTENDEVLVAGTLYAGYLSEPSFTDHLWRTGDLDRRDDEGFLHLRGRKGELLGSVFGRDLSLQWPESELVAQDGPAQAAVFGESRCSLSRSSCPSRAWIEDGSSKPFSNPTSVCQITRRCADILS